MPPTMGAAMRCITSEPVPVPHMMGNRPARMTATVNHVVQMFFNANIP